MKKLLLVALLVLFATQNARAEKDGFFVGGSVFPAISMGITTNEYKYRNQNRTNESDKELAMSLVQLAFGYTHSLDERLGLRYYGVFYFGLPLTFNVDFANVDVLYTIIKGESAELRAFAGVWLGWESYYRSILWDNSDAGYNSGLDLGANAGLRLVLAQRHGVEIYGRFGFLSQTKEYPTTYWIESYKIRQPYLIGVRYTISF